jgi:hypothetical protein
LWQALEHRFPLNVRVTATGTSRDALNGRSGLVRKYDGGKGRVGVEFAPPHGLVSLRPANLVIEPEARREELLRRVRASAPRTKR